MPKLHIPDPVQLPDCRPIRTEEVAKRCKLDTLPTVLRDGPYRLFFYSVDRDEPPHVHVERENNTAKFWLEPIRLDRSRGFSRAEILRIQHIVEENVAKLMRAWDEYFKN